MSKTVIVDYEKCVGCKTCEQACSAKQVGIVEPSLSRIGITRFQMGIENFPIVCQQCQSAPCQAVCPIKAISMDEILGRIVIDYDKCIGCRLCVAICPFGCMMFDRLNKKVFKCQLCDGDPICVKFCQHGALQYVEASEQSAVKQLVYAERLSDATHKIKTTLDTVKVSSLEEEKTWGK